LKDKKGARKRKMEPSEGGLLRFIGDLSSKQQKSSVKKENVRKEEREPIARFPESEVYRKIIKYLEESRQVAKSELYKWSRKNNIRPVDLYNTLLSLEREGKLKKVFDADKMDVIYVFSS